MLHYHNFAVIRSCTYLYSSN